MFSLSFIEALFLSTAFYIEQAMRVAAESNRRAKAEEARRKAQSWTDRAKVLEEEFLQAKEAARGPANLGKDKKEREKQRQKERRAAKQAAEAQATREAREAEKLSASATLEKVEPNNSIY